MLGSNVNFGQYSSSRQAAYDRLAQARQAKLDAEVQAAREEAERDARTGSDMQQLGALAVQGGLAYATGGASLAFAPMIDKASWTAMGKPQAAGTGISGAASSLGQAGYGIAQANKAEALAVADKAFERNMANQERRYKALMDAGYEEAAFDITSDMQAMDEGYQKNRKAYIEGSKTGQGFLDDMLGRRQVDTGFQRYEGPRVSQLEDTKAINPTPPKTESQKNFESLPKDVQDSITMAIGAEPSEPVNPNEGRTFRGQDGRVYEYDANGNIRPLLMADL